MANKPNVGPDPVEATPNHVREKTYREPETPQPYEDELTALPEVTAKDKVKDEMPAAVDKLKQRLSGS